jgi:phenylalanyl-tRNA synthetase beta subunit
MTNDIERYNWWHSEMDTFLEEEKKKKISYGLRLTFQSDEKTLTKEDVDNAIDNITKELKDKFGAQIRK